ncbi:hypothetical protein T492DRAFT_1151059 [Pavlovales sp. CCMP2436]|nr:hypothetical protein T492DRAFT_1151059 [Pavlovales sp. CCMP2436]
MLAIALVMLSSTAAEHDILHCISEPFAPCASPEDAQAPYRRLSAGDTIPLEPGLLETIHFDAALILGIALTLSDGGKQVTRGSGAGGAWGYLNAYSSASFSAEYYSAVTWYVTVLSQTDWVVIGASSADTPLAVSTGIHGLFMDGDVDGENVMFGSYNANTELLWTDVGNGYGTLNPWANPFATNDKIGVHLDLIANTIRFSKNDIDQGIVPQSVAPGREWRLGVSLRGEGNAVTTEGVIATLKPSPDAELILKRDHSAVIFGKQSDASITRIPSGDLELRPGTERSVVKVMASLRVSGTAMLGDGGDACEDTHRGTLRFVKVEDGTDLLQLCSITDSSLGWRTIAL